MGFSPGVGGESPAICDDERAQQHAQHRSRLASLRRERQHWRARLSSCLLTANTSHSLAIVVDYFLTLQRAEVRSGICQYTHVNGVQKGVHVLLGREAFMRRRQA